MKPIRPVALVSALVSAPVFALLSALALLLLMGAARAEDPVFPPGIRIGIVPLVGLVPAKKFTGFESQDESVKVLMAELPPDAYGEVMNALKTNPTVAGGARPEGIETAAGMAYYTVETARNGASVVHRYSMILSGGTFSGYVAVQVPENASKIYSDEAVRRMFATATVRKEVPTQELLELIPFRVDDLGDFKTVRALATGGAILLADGDEKIGFEAAPFMVVGLMASSPALPEDRGRFAEQAVASIPGVHSSRITMSEPLRIDGMAGYETRIDAISGRDNTPVSVVQWLRFGGQNALRIIGSAPRDQWSSAFPRFRAVRDGIHPR